MERGRKDRDRETDRWHGCLSAIGSGSHQHASGYSQANQHRYQYQYET